MTLGFGALAGVVPLVGFFTKDAIVHGAYEQAAHGNLVWPWVAWLLLASMVVTAALTVAYSLRVWLLVFFGAGPDARRCTRPRPRCGCRCWCSRCPPRWAASWSPSRRSSAPDPGAPLPLVIDRRRR